MISIDSPDGQYSYNITETSSNPLTYQVSRYDRFSSGSRQTWNGLSRQQAIDAMANEISPIADRMSREEKLKADIIEAIREAGKVER